MKILAIRGCNLASLEGEFEIDFTAEPLKSAGIFAITGCTGSGKSTILDAVCLALFNNTPRINKVERDNIIDVKDITVALSDSRNILRRGTGFGYAEVDFVSLSDEKYRSRWSVRRARDKASGSLQDWMIKLDNLTTGESQQGGKKELLVKIKELIGLSFDQFTRAVLLAQGDFATFLKADKKEKADLLEKLTGTDIYSKISSRIYEKAGIAKSEYDAVRRNIDGVELLSDEQLTELSAELEGANTKVKELEQRYNLQNEKIKWLDVEEVLLQNISLAKNQLDSNNEILVNAKPRFEYLALLDSVQEIRDDFKSLESTRVQLEQNQVLLKSEQEFLEKGKANLTSLQIEVDNLNNAQKQIKEQWDSVQSQVIEARKLDVQIDGAKSNLLEVDKELTKTQKQKTLVISNITKITQEIEQNQLSLNTFSGWFETNAIYSSIIPKYDLIISYIKDAENVIKQTLSNGKQIVKIQKLLSTDRVNLEKQKLEADRLNTILPTEIASLRSRLILGEPCPVCGSTHHPISNEPVDTLAEKELEESKQSIATEIERIETNIKNRESEVISLTSLVAGYEKQQTVLMTNIDELLTNIPDWKVSFKAGTLSVHIKSKATDWKDKEAQQVIVTNSLSLKEQELKTAKSKLEEIELLVSNTQIKYNDISRELETLKTNRSVLFEGVEVSVVEKNHLSEINKASSVYEAKMQVFNKLNESIKEKEGAIAQLNINITKAENEKSILSNKVIAWLTARQDYLDEAQLAELLANSSEWLTSERKALDLLKSKVLTTKTTLEEREKNHLEHQQNEVKPTDEETKELLTSEMISASASIVEQKERITDISVLISSHNSGKKKIEAFEKELTEKGEIANSWQKLNELFGSADGGKFKTMAQGYTLDVLLDYANKHLSEISDRYLLERVSTESLSLQVRDLDMLSEIRSVHSLSGGESFLISLALALGLSSLSSNRMRIESLFIDEGFGTLDAETLRMAMDVLERLQTQGRKIGVISHVAEMTERITTQIKVVKTTNNRSSVIVL
ncbi:MAG: AAA family ATPase [Rikenellaceae bacterium]